MRKTLTGLSAVFLLISTASASAQDSQRLDRLFDQLDTNHDGLITRAEFEASRHSRFLTLDRNHDGFLSPAHFPRLVGFARRRLDALGAAISRFDLDHDGRVSEAEFVRFSLALFDEADTNHDGVLTRAEAQAAAMRLRAEIEPPR
jgi:Ca2+-binding EF-hand superfamily protein